MQLKMKGYLLLEALISIAIFSIGVLGIAVTQLNMIRQATHSQNRTEAVSLVNSAITDMQSNPTKEDCYTTSASCGDDWKSRAASLSGANDQNYTVLKDDDGRVTITVSWSMKADQTHGGSEKWYSVSGTYFPIVGEIQ